MRWPWSRPCESEKIREARAEMDVEVAGLREVQSRRGEAERLAAIGRDQQERNHFGEGIERAMRRRFAS